MSYKDSASFLFLLLSRIVIQCFPFYREHFGHKHPKYSDTLLDYGFYLLNVDNICQSVAIYQVSRVIGSKRVYKFCCVSMSSFSCVVLNILSFLTNSRQHWTSDSLCSGGRTSTLPQPMKTWPTPHMCTSTALENLTTHCK